jgi:hypothetical protein
MPVIEATYKSRSKTRGPNSELGYEGATTARSFLTRSCHVPLSGLVMYVS